MLIFLVNNKIDQMYHQLLSTNQMAKVNITLILPTNIITSYLCQYLKFLSFLELIKEYFYKTIFLSLLVKEYTVTHQINFHKIFYFTCRLLSKIGVIINFIKFISLHHLQLCLFVLQVWLHKHLLFYLYPKVTF
jgi:hypothetical protein